MTTIVFDLDGTLADTMADLIPALNRTIAEHGLTPVAAESVGAVVGHGAKAMIARAFELAGEELPSDLHERLFARFIAEYGARIADETNLFAGAQEALDTLLAGGARLAVCTNKMERHARKLLDALGVEHLFAAITGGDSFTFRKPDGRHLLETIRLAGGNAEQAVMVGDSETDIAAARNAAVPVIAVTFGYSLEPVSRYSPDRIISHFRQLPSAVQSLLAERVSAP